MLVHQTNLQLMPECEAREYKLPALLSHPSAVNQQKWAQMAPPGNVDCLAHSVRLKFPFTANDIKACLHFVVVVVD